MRILDDILELEQIIIYCYFAKIFVKIYSPFPIIVDIIKSYYGKFHYEKSRYMKSHYEKSAKSPQNRPFKNMATLKYELK